VHGEVTRQARVLQDLPHGPHWAGDRRFHLTSGRRIGQARAAHPLALVQRLPATEGRLAEPSPQLAKMLGERLSEVDDTSVAGLRGADIDLLAAHDLPGGEAHTSPPQPKRLVPTEARQRHQRPRR
jgi:hypothetical protein